MTSIIKVDQIQTAAGTAPTAADLGINTTGTVLQVVNNIRTTSMTWASTAIVDQLAATITPKSTSSKILVQCHIVGTGQHGWLNVLAMSMRRDSTFIAKFTEGGSTTNNNGWASMGGPAYADSGRIMETFSLSYLDSPITTNATVYTLASRSDNASATVYTGRWSLNTDAGAVTTLTLTEIAG
jgi:hypothetical protein